MASIVIWAIQGSGFRVKNKFLVSWWPKGRSKPKNSWPPKLLYGLIKVISPKEQAPHMLGESKKNLFIFLLIMALTKAIFPMAQAETHAPISLEIIQKAALIQAEKVYGQVYFFEDQRFTDLNGDLSAVVFTFYRKKGQLPNRRLISEKVNQYVGLSRQSKDPSGKGARKYVRFLRQTDDFVTVVAGVSYQSPALILMVDGLFKHIFLLPKVRQVIESGLGVKVDSISDFIYLHPLSFFIEFPNPYPGKKGNILINLQTFRVTTRDELKAEISQQRKVRSDNNQDTSREKAWSEESYKEWKGLEDLISNQGKGEDKAKVRTINTAINEKNSLRVMSHDKTGEVFTQASAGIFNGYIPDVPNINQTSDDCSAVSATQVLGYWDAHGFPKLVDDTFFNLTKELRQAMDWFSGRNIPDPDVRAGLEKVCNNSQYNNNYHFQIYLDDYYPLPYWEDLKAEIDNGRPLLIGVKGYLDYPRPYNNHWMCVVGYYEGFLATPDRTTKWVIVHDNTPPDDDEPYIDWNTATDCIIRIIPPEVTPPVTRKDIDKKIKDLKEGTFSEAQLKEIIDNHMKGE